MQIPVTCDPDAILQRRSIADLKAFQGSTKTLRRDQYDKLRNSIERHGFLAPVFVWDGWILDGHQRLHVCESEGWDIEGGVPVVEIEAKDARDAAEKLLLISSTYGKIDTQGLYEFTELHGLALPEWDIHDLPDFDHKAFIDEFYEEPVIGLTDPDAVPDAAPQRCSPGDVWQLGEHRLLCGDATSQADVGRLMGGEEPFIMVTDPPYGVEYDPEWRHRAGVNHSDRRGSVTNDDRANWAAAFELFTGAVAYVWHSDRRVGESHNGLTTAGFEIRSQIIWVKQMIALGRSHYHWKHEPCYYAHRQGGSAEWSGGRKQSTVWEINNPLNSGEEATIHGTQKPIECMARPMRNHGEQGNITYDPFVGSGTSIIAAEQEKRRCLAMEIDPVYCDVAIQRWEDFTGKVASKVEAAPLKEVA